MKTFFLDLLRVTFSHRGTRFLMIGTLAYVSSNLSSCVIECCHKLFQHKQEGRTYTALLLKKKKKTLARENHHKNRHLTPSRESTLLNHLQWKKKRVTSGPHQRSAVSHLTINV